MPGDTALKIKQKLLTTNLSLFQNRYQVYYQRILLPALTKLSDVSSNQFIKRRALLKIRQSLKEYVKAGNRINLASSYIRLVEFRHFNESVLKEHYPIIKFQRISWIVKQAKRKHRFALSGYVRFMPVIEKIIVDLEEFLLHDKLHYDREMLPFYSKAFQKIEQEKLRLANKLEWMEVNLNFCNEKLANLYEVKELLDHEKLSLDSYVQMLKQLHAIHLYSTKVKMRVDRLLQNGLSPKSVPMILYAFTKESQAPAILLPYTKRISWKNSADLYSKILHDCRKESQYLFSKLYA